MYFIICESAALVHGPFDTYAEACDYRDREIAAASCNARHSIVNIEHCV